jgi:DivIVA domain-containing protein
VARSSAFLDKGVAVLVLAVLLLAGMLFGVAAVSVGHGSAMSDTAPDRRDPLLPGRRVAPEDVESLRFTMAVRGYRMDEVDAVLDRLSAELSVRDAELSRLRGSVLAAAPGDAAREGEQPSEPSEPSAAFPAPAADEASAAASAYDPLDPGVYGGLPPASPRHPDDDPLGA